MPRIALLVCLALAPAASGQDSGRQAIAALKRAFRKITKPELLQDKRSAALDRVAELDNAPLALALVQAYERLEAECLPIVRKRRGILLEDSGLKLERHRDLLHPLRSLQQQVSVRIGRLRSEDARRAIGKMLARQKLPLQLKLVGARLAAGLFDATAMRPKPGRPLEELLVILEAVRSLERGGTELGDHALAALQRSEPIAREQAIDTLAALCWPESLRPLIDYLEQETDHRLKERAGNALCVLTRQNLGPSHVSWSAWLRERGGPYLRGERRLGGGKPKSTERTSKGYYFGFPLDRSSILFVHDNSLSMRRPLGNSTRIKRSRDELEQALGTLKPTQRFNIVLLANRVWSFETKQVSATPRNVERAKTWLRYQPIELGTNIYNALETAFVLAGRGVRDRYYDAQIDTVFLLSDGAPTRYLGRGRGGQGGGQGGGRGPGEKPNHILQAVDRWNLFGRIEIHTIFLGGDPDGGGGGRRGLRFMRQLAKQNNGRFKAVD